MGTTFEEQQAARNKYQDKVRSAKGGNKPININPTHTTPNPAVDEGATVGEQADERKDETTAEEIQESGEEMGTYGAPAVDRVEENDESETDEEVAADAEATGDDESADGPDDEVSEKPAKSAAKAEWVAYVAATSDLTEEEADAKTKDELIEEFG